MVLSDSMLHIEVTFTDAKQRKKCLSKINIAFMLFAQDHIRILKKEYTSVLREKYFLTLTEYKFVK
jgi:hypothetical protein